MSWARAKRTFAFASTARERTSVSSWAASRWSGPASLGSEQGLADGMLGDRALGQEAALGGDDHADVSSLADETRSPQDHARMGSSRVVDQLVINHSSTQ